MWDVDYKMDRPQTHKKDFLCFLGVSFSLCLDNVHTNTLCTLEFRELIQVVGGGAFNNS